MAEIRNFTMTTVFPAKVRKEDLNGSRASRATQKPICGWLRPCTLGDFLLLVQEKVTKEKDTRSLRRAQYARFPVLLARSGARLTRRSLDNAPRARSEGSRQPLIALRCSARSDGVLKTPTLAIPAGGLERQVFSGPRSARRVPQPQRGFSSETVFEPETRSVRPASWRAPGGARNGGSSRALRGVFSFGDFSLDKQRKVTCRGSATHKYTRPKAARHIVHVRN